MRTKITAIIFLLCFYAIKAYSQLTVDSIVVANSSSSCTCTGKATAYVSKGYPPYTYSWSNGELGKRDTNLCPGNYTLILYDAHGDSTGMRFRIGPAIMTVTIRSNGAGCADTAGSATSFARGGAIPYTYSWSSGATTATASNLSAGTYSVTITDRNGCTSSVSVTVGVSGPAPTIAIVNDSCNGKSDGSATITNITGGVSPYTYSWAPSGGTTNSATGLSAGTYTLTIKDAGGCSGTTLVMVRQPPAMTLIVDTVGATNGCNGIANIRFTGTNGPFTFTWSAPNITTKALFNTAVADSLCAGRYLLCITNRVGCTLCDSVIISGKVATGVSQLKNASSAINLYPDPARSKLTIQVNGISTQTCQLEIYDMLGREVMQQNNISIESGKPILLNVSGLPQGEYMLRINNSSLNEYQPFIIVH